MLEKLNNLSKLFDILPKTGPKEIINEDKYLEKYKERINTVLTDSWIDAINESYDKSEREKNKQSIFKYDLNITKNLFKKQDSFIYNLLETKNELIEYLYEEQKNKDIDDITKKIYMDYIELIERIYYEDMLVYSKMNAYRIFDNLKILREIFKHMSILFFEKMSKIQTVKSLEKDNWDYYLILDLEEYEDIVENYTYEIFNNLENILEKIYKYYHKNTFVSIDKEKEFFVYFLVEIHKKWIPMLENIDKKLYSI